MGFLRMQQQNFGGAISYLTEAEQDGYKAKTVEQALGTSRFWYTMAEANGKPSIKISWAWRKPSTRPRWS